LRPKKIIYVGVKKMVAATKYPKLFEPGYIGTVKTRNRMLRMGASPGFVPYEGGYVQQYYFDFFEAIAKGGIGLITVNASPLGAPPGKGFGITDDKYIARLKELTDLIHKYECPALIQLFHIGPWLPAPLTLAASSISKKDMPITTQSFPDAHELTIPEIKDIISKFGEACERAQKAGFDGMELNAGCTHLLNTFLSRAWNKRKDEFGSDSMENRCRIITEIIKDARRRTGKGFAIVVLFNAAEPGLEDGITSKESQEMSRIFEAAGADAIHARVEFYVTRKATGLKDSTHFPDVAMYPETPAYAAASGVDISKHGEGGWTLLAAAIKKVVKIPVIATGRLDPEIGEKLIKKSAIDFINMNRRVLADHDYPNKVKEGRNKEIAPCTACMTCFNVNEEGKPLVCRINSAMGKEGTYQIKPAAKKKKVVIIGGGPAGMEAARVAALRGHYVTLFEKEPMLGGAMNLAAVVKGVEREDLLAIVDYFKEQLELAHVDVMTGKEANRAMVEELKPDVVIVAVGGAHWIPEIQGIENKNVLTSKALHSQLKSYLKISGARLMAKLVKQYLPVGKKVVIMGGNIQGCQTAEFLTKRGRKVTIVESGPKVGEGLLPYLIGPQLLDWLNKKDVTMLSGVKYEEINSKGLVITTKEGKKETIEVDTILTALPLKANEDLFNSLKGVATEIHHIGDCSNPGLIVDAVADGARVGYSV
jgi:2,4-dienoyl-CoA reductase (NADPH2)